MEYSRNIVVDGKKIHFYCIGSGPAIVLLHPSPHNADILLPLANALSSRYTVIGLDTPGYGRSERLAVNPSHLADYTTVLHKAFKLMNLNRPALYGSATGAQLAIRYGLDYPEHVSHIFLDNAAHFDKELRAAILESYFPDLTPQIDGSHLPQLWKIVSQMFQYFPWCFTADEYALNRPQLPPSALHAIAMDYLKAGKYYDLAYKLAFQHERGEYVQKLTAPTTIFRWTGSIITKYIDNLLTFEFPENISSVSIEGDAADRMQRMTQYISSKASTFENYVLPGSIDKMPGNPPINFQSGKAKFPEIDDDGQYLMNAWHILVKDNPGMNADEIQACLIEWNTNSNK